MSRIGKKPVEIPAGVQVKIQERTIEVKGSKGELKRTLHPTVDIVQEGSALKVTTNTAKREDRCYHGLCRSLVQNMVTGVSTGFEKKLKLIGVGYRAAVKGSELHLTLGYSHPVVYQIPAGISIKAVKPTELTVEGVDKEKVGQSAADIRSYRKPEPYHGKGIRLADEVIKTKVGKSGAKK